MDKQDASRTARSPRLCRPDRSQQDPHPKTLDELIAEDHPARLIWELTQSLDMGPLYEDIKAVESHPGRPTIDPAILTALWMYATTDSIASARKLARLCGCHDAYKWICGGVEVSYHTLSDFRTDHAEWLEEQIVITVATMRKEGLIDLQSVGQDGMRVRANAGSSSFKREEKLDAALSEAQQQWDQLQAEFEAGACNSSAREQAARERAVRQRMERVQRAQQEREQVAAARERRQKGDGRHARASTTDPEARRMKMPDGGYRPAYNVQFATTLDSLVIVGADVINAGGDGGQMEPMIDRIEQQQGELPGEYYTDGGFSTKDDIEHVGRRGVEVYTPIKEEDKQKRAGKDPYAPRPGEGPNATEWRKRMGTEAAKEKYKQRCKCEWSNARCRNWGLWQFTVRGLQKVRAVVLWYALTHNLLRMVALCADQA